MEQNKIMNKYMIDYGYNTTFELCPECSCEIELPLDRLIDCPECGHKEVLPCSACELCLDGRNCDWNEETRCTPFKRIKT